MQQTLHLMYRVTYLLMLYLLMILMMSIMQLTAREEKTQPLMKVILLIITIHTITEIATANEQTTDLIMQHVIQAKLLISVMK